MTLDYIEREFKALLDPDDIPGSWTPRQRDAYLTRRRELRQLRSSVHAANEAIAEVEPEIATLTKWRGHLTQWRKKLGDDLLALPPRDKRQRGYHLSITRIDRGLDFVNEAFPVRLPLDDLMAADGFVPRDSHARARGEAWFGTLPQVDQRLAFLQRKRDEAQARVDAVGRLPELELVIA